MAKSTERSVTGSIWQKEKMTYLCETWEIWAFQIESKARYGHTCLHIPALGRLRQEISEFETSLVYKKEFQDSWGYTETLCLKTKQNPTCLSCLLIYLLCMSVHVSRCTCEGQKTALWELVLSFHRPQGLNSRGCDKCLYPLSRLAGPTSEHLTSLKKKYHIPQLTSFP